MLQQELLIEIINKLNSTDTDYMLTGSIVSSLQGEPRLTNDIDVIIQIKEKEISKFINSFSKDEYYFNENTIREAVISKDHFNLISRIEGSKIDFWLLTDSDFDRTRFSRRIKERFLGIDIVVSTPEDTILEKLYWTKISGASKKQFKDALRVFEVQYPILDKEYLEYWAKKLDVENHFLEIKEEAGYL